MLFCRASAVVAEVEGAPPGEVAMAGAESEMFAPGTSLSPWTLMLVPSHSPLQPDRNIYQTFT